MRPLFLKLKKHVYIVSTVYKRKHEILLTGLRMSRGCLALSINLLRQFGFNAAMHMPNRAFSTEFM